ncbi:hypothetical protein D3C73_728600 [compost metagenome]
MATWKARITAILIGSVIFLILPLPSSAIQQLDQQSLSEHSAPIVEVEQLEALTPSSAIAMKPIPSNMQEQDKPKAISLDSAIRQWTQTLSEEKGFETWKKAAWTTYPLGPGTHGWVVILSKGTQEIGYLVIHAVEDGSLQLTEYGTGEHPLFSLNTLYRSLLQQEIIPSSTSLSGFIQDESISKQRWYRDALNALWIIEIEQAKYLVEAKSGEVLPIDQVPDTPYKYVPNYATNLSGTSSGILLPAFDPYERLPWVQGEPTAVNGIKELEAQLTKQPKLTYVAELFQDQVPVTLSLAVIGYQQWDSQEPYLIVDHEGPRYFPLIIAINHGEFYP